jgi:hypothetical protein
MWLIRFFVVFCTQDGGCFAIHAYESDFRKYLVASVEFAEQRTLSMGDMAESVPDAGRPVAMGWSR